MTLKKTNELIETLKKHPDRELIFLYPEEGSEYSYTLGFPKQIVIDEYWIDDERVWLKHENEEEFQDHYGDHIADELFSEFPLTDEQEKVVDKKLEEFTETRDWKKCICVFIGY